jgi:dihydrofolate reductase
VAKLRVHNIGVSIDGYMAAADQDLENPIGRGGMALFDWVWKTRTGRELRGEEGGSTDIDDAIAARGTENIGASILGRNMFGPVRGPWQDESWKGWWGEDPPYHTPVFVVTHHARADLPMLGGTTFHFVTDGIESALRQAFEAADGQDVRLGGGAATIRAYLAAGLVDELHLVQVPILLGSGERIFDDPAGLSGFACVERVCSDDVTHIVLARS